MTLTRDAVLSLKSSVVGGAVTSEAHSDVVTGGVKGGALASAQFAHEPGVDAVAVVDRDGVVPTVEVSLHTEVNRRAEVDS